MAQVVATFSANISPFQAAMGKMKGSVDGAIKSTSQMAQRTHDAMSTVSKTATAAGAAMTAMGVASLKSYGSFQQSLNKAAVIAGGTSKDIGELADMANRMGAELPLSAQDAADAMVSMAQDGASIKTITKEFPAIAEAATATGADLQTTASVVQQAMNIWGKSLKSPAQAAAILTETANVSNASIEDMQQALATIGGTASNAGFGMGDMSEAIGLMTNKGFTAAQASLDLNHAILQMQAPSKGARKEMTALGLSFTDSSGKMKPFPQILREVAGATDKMSASQKTAALKTMFNTSGMQAMLPLIKSIGDTSGSTTTSWSAYAAALDKVSGSTAESTAFLKDQANEMQQNLGSKIEQVGGNWESLRNTALASTSGINSGVVDLINKALEWAQASKSSSATAIRGFVGLLPEIGATVTATGSYISVANGLSTLLKKKEGTLATFGRALVNPWTLGLGAVAGFTAIVVKAYQQSEVFRGAVAKIGDAFNNVFGPSVKAATTFLQSLWSSITGGSSSSSSVINNLAKTIGDNLGNALNSIDWEKAFGTAKSILDVVSNALSMVVDAVSNVTSAFPSLTNVFGSNHTAAVVLTGAMVLLSGKFTSIGGIVGSVLKFFISFGSTTSSLAGGAVAGLGSSLTGLVGKFSSSGLASKSFSSIIKGISGVMTSASTPTGILKNAIGLLGSKLTLGNTAGLALKGGMSALGTIMSAVAGPVGILMAAVAAITLAMGVGGMFTSVDNLTNAMTQFGNNVETVAPVVGTTFGQVIQGMLTAIANAIPGIVQGALTLMTSFANSMASALPQIITVASSLISTITTTITSLLPQIISSALKIIASFISGIAQGLPSIMASAIQLLTAFITSLATGLPKLIVAGTKFIVNLLMGISQAMPKLMAAAVGTVVSFLAQLTANLPKLIPAGANFIVKLLNGIAQQMPKLITAAVNVITKFFDGLAKNAGKLISSGTNLVVKVALGIANNLGKFVSAAVTIVIKLLGALADNAPKLLKAGLDFIVKIVQGIANSMGQIGSAAVKIIDALARGLRGAVQTIITAGAYLVGQLARAIVSLPGQLISGGGDMAKAFVRGFRGQKYEASSAGREAGSAVKDGLSWVNLFSNGASIMSGFFSGLQSQWGAISGWVSGIASWIGQHKGPISYDKRVLIPNGRAIMNGFDQGLQAQYAVVQKNVAGMADGLADSVADAVDSIHDGDLQMSAASYEAGDLTQSIDDSDRITPTFVVHNELVGDKIQTIVKEGDQQSAVKQSYFREYGG